MDMGWDLVIGGGKIYRNTLILLVVLIGSKTMTAIGQLVT